MNINGVKNSGYFEQVNPKSGKSTENKGTVFAGNLAQSSNYGQHVSESQDGSLKKEIPSDYLSRAVSELNRGNSRVHKSAVAEAQVKNYPTGTYDYVQADIEAGVLYKAKLLEDQKTVYVEKKDEEGEITAYEVTRTLISEDTKDPVERAALAACENKKQESEEDIQRDFKEALLKFYEYVQERVKNGPPKFQIGSAQMSVKEWDKLLKEVDETLDEIKEELQQKEEKQKEEKQKEQIEEESALEDLI